MSQSPDDNKIPRFETIEDEAAFWDVHDTTEFEDEFEPVEVVFARPLIHREFAVPLDAQTVERLGRLAQERGVDTATLARLWIMDRLHAEIARAA